MRCHSQFKWKENTVVETMAVAGVCRLDESTNYMAAGAAGPRLVCGALLFPSLARISVGGCVAVDVRTQQTHREC